MKVKQCNIWLFQKENLSTTISMKRSRRELSINMVNHKVSLKTKSPCSPVLPSHLKQGAVSTGYIEPSFWLVLTRKRYRHLITGTEVANIPSKICLLPKYLQRAESARKVEPPSPPRSSSLPVVIELGESRGWGLGWGSTLRGALWKRQGKSQVRQTADH